MRSPTSDDGSDWRCYLRDRSPAAGFPDIKPSDGEAVPTQHVPIERRPIPPGQLLRGRDLRHAALHILVRAGRPLTVPEILRALGDRGFVVAGRAPNKVLADALGHEVSRGRIRRTGRGRYAVGHLSRTIAWRIAQRMQAQ